MMMAGMIGAGVSAIGSIAQGQAQAKAYRQQAESDRINSQLDQRQAVTDQITGQFKQRQMYDQATALAGKQITAAGAAGVSLEGSPTDVVLDSRRESMLDIGAIKYNTDLKSDNSMYKARLSNYNAAQEMEAADQAERNGMLGAMTSIVGGFSKLGGSAFA